MNIYDYEIGARRVGRSAELAGNHHALDRPRRIPERAKDLDRRAREVARQSVLVQEYGAVVLGGHMDVLRLGTVSDETRHLLYADLTCRRPLKCEANKLGSEPRAGPGFQERI